MNTEATAPLYLTKKERNALALALSIAAVTIARDAVTQKRAAARNASAQTLADAMATDSAEITALAAKAWRLEYPHD